MAEPKDPQHPIALLRMIEYGDPEAEPVSPVALMRMIEYVIAEAQQVSPVAAMLLTLARRELIPLVHNRNGVVVPFRPQ